MTNAHTRARLVAGQRWAATRRRWPSTSSPCRPTPRRSPSSASTPPTCSASGTGSAAATRWTRRSACPRCSRSARTTSARCSPASTRWTSTSARRRSSATCRCCWACSRVWYNDFFGAQTVAVLPYEQYLKRFPAYLQQLTMESNGKHVTLDGTRVDYDTGADLLGRAGHQRPALVLPADPPGHAAHPVRLHRVREAAQPARAAPRHADGQRVRAGRGARVRQDAGGGEGGRHAGLARAASRVRGQPPVEHDAARQARRPAALGQLVALYEHSVFTQGTIWNIDSFDQWGVELGKVLAQRIIPELSSATSRRSRTTARPTRSSAATANAGRHADRATAADTTSKETPCNSE